MSIHFPGASPGFVGTTPPGATSRGDVLARKGAMPGPGSDPRDPKPEER